VKVLVLEDDRETAGDVATALEKASHDVDLFEDGLDAFQRALKDGYDVIVVDRMVPGADGLTVVRKLRSAGVSTPVLFLTSMGGVGDRVEGLDAGGDDYLVKPFDMLELTARINALGRRGMSGGGGMLQVADLEMDTVRRTVSRAGRSIHLQPQEFKLLEFMIRNRGQLVTRKMLLENVWGFHFDPGTNIVESHMSRVRAKVDRPFRTELIETVRGAGYRFGAAA
jgi:two-component system OmpR family response regulator